MNKKILITLILCILLITSIFLIGCGDRKQSSNDKSASAYNAEYNRAIINIGGEWYDLPISYYYRGDTYVIIITTEGIKFYASKENILLYYIENGKPLL